MPTLKDTWFELSESAKDFRVDEYGNITPEAVGSIADRIGLDNRAISDFLLDDDIKFSLLKNVSVEGGILPDMIGMMGDPMLAREFVLMIQYATKLGILLGAAYTRAQIAELNDDVHGG